MNTNCLVLAKMMMAICFFIFPYSIMSQVTQTFTTVGTTGFTVPAGVSSLSVECWGGGGAGGGCTATPYATGGGGAGGAYSRSTSLTAIPCSTYNIIVGAGGVSASARVGGAGGSSSFGNLISASGGTGGGVNGTGASINGIGSDITIGDTYDGGAGGTGTATSSSSGTSGAGGGGAGASGDGGSASGGTAGAAGAGGGGAGAAGKNTTGGGTAGSAPGGGGSGGRNAGTGSVQSGGNGGRGQVKVTYTCPTYSISAVSATAICTGNPSVITLTGNSSSLPQGTYTVTYNISSPNTTSGATATMTADAVGVGTFNTANLNNQGTNTITITNIKSGSGTGCSTAVTGRTASFTTSSQPAPLAEFTQGALDTVSNIAVCGTIGGGGQNDMDIESGSPSGSLIQWQISSDGGSTWTNAPGPTATATQYVLNPVYCSFESVAGTYYFRVIVTNGSCIGISNRIKLMVSGTSNLTGGVIGSDQNFCNSGDPATLTQITASTGGSASYTYQWQSSTDSVNFSVISGATSSTYNPPVVSQTTYYRRITVSGGCRAYSNTVRVLITTSVPVSPSNISGYSTVCAGSSGFDYSITSISGVSSYTWSVPSGWSITSGAGTTSVTITSGAVGQNGNISVYASNVCGAGLASVLAVSTTAGSSQAVMSGDTTICGGTSTGIRVQITGGAAPYELVYSNGTSNTTISNYQSEEMITVAPAATTNYSIVSVSSVGGCTGTSNQGSAIVTIATPGTWLGTVDNDWSNPLNWCGGVPDQSTDVIVPSDRPNTPIVINNAATVKDINISSGTEVIVNGQFLKVTGNIIANGNLNVLNGSIELAGNTMAQNFAGSMLQQKKIKNLRISNPFGVNFTGTGDTLILTGILDFGASNCTLNTNGNLTLHSSSSGTAAVADMTARGIYEGNRIIGNVNYEKYIPLQSKAWRLLAAPATGQTIKSAWQGGNNSLSNAMNPGYGTIITSNLTGATSTLGFDIYTPAGATMKVYNSTTDGWDGVSSTYNLMNNPKGYMIFIRGDRSVTAFNQAPTPTTMRMTGSLYTPLDNPPTPISVAADKYESVGNPYACTIDFGSVGKTGGVQDVLYLWDPGLTISQYSSYGLGGFQTIVNNGSGYEVIPGGGSYGDTYKGIPSGQAFFVHATGTGGQIQFNENCKITDTAQVMRSSFSAAGTKKLKIRYSVMSNGNPILLDGTMAMFDEEFTDSIDTKDVLKIGNNLSENIGLFRSNKRFAVERRGDMLEPDTLFLSFNALKRVTYQLELIPSGFGENEVNAWLVDKYLNTSVSISMDSAQKIFFTVDNNALSAATDRFYIKFQPVVTGVMVAAPVPRVKNNAVQDKKTVGMTSIAQIEKGQITFGPNPLKGNNLNMSFNGVKPGKYQLMVYNGLGHLIMKKEMRVLEGTSRNILHLPGGLAAGQYQLAIEQAGTCLWSEPLQVN